MYRSKRGVNNRKRIHIYKYSYAYVSIVVASKMAMPLKRQLSKSNKITEQTS